MRRYGGVELGSLRFLYCHERKILSIHYFEFQGDGLVGEEFLNRRNYAQQMVLREGKEKTKIFLTRTKLRKQLGLVQNKIVYKIVSFSINID